MVGFVLKNWSGAWPWNFRTKIFGKTSVLDTTAVHVRCGKLWFSVAHRSIIHFCVNSRFVDQCPWKWKASFNPANHHSFIPASHSSLDSHLCWGASNVLLEYYPQQEFHSTQVFCQPSWVPPLATYGQEMLRGPDSVNLYHWTEIWEESNSAQFIGKLCWVLSCSLKSGLWTRSVRMPGC